MEEKKQWKGWKTLAIIFIILFTLETLYVVWSVSLALEEEKKTNECYYDICSDTVEAYYELDMCTCYDYDYESGEYTEVRTKYIG